MQRRITIEEHDASEPSMTRQASRLHIELSVVMGGRIGDGQTSLGLGALSFLELTGWLIGFEGRADRYRTLADAAPGKGADRQSDGGALELAVLGGRRFRSRDLALDLTAGFAAAMQGTATFEAQPSATGTTISKSSSSTVPRVLLGGRVNFSARVRQAGHTDEIVECENVSKGGLCFHSLQKYALNSLMEIAAPYSPGEAALFVHAKIKRIEALSGGLVFRYGLEYMKSPAPLA